MFSFSGHEYHWMEIFRFWLKSRYIMFDSWRVNQTQKGREWMENQSRVETEVLYHRVSTQYLWVWPHPSQTYPLFRSQLYTCKASRLKLLQCDTTRSTQSIYRHTDEQTDVITWQSIQNCVSGSSCYNRCLQEHILPSWHTHGHTVTMCKQYNLMPSRPVKPKAA